MSIGVSLKQTDSIINENIYGQFIEETLTCIHGGIYDPESKYAGTDGVRTDVVEKIKEPGFRR